MKPEAELRVAGPDDAERLALIGRATFLESYAGLLPVADILAHNQQQHAASLYSGWLADPAYRCWLAEAVPGAAPIGYLVLSPVDLPLADLDERDIEIKRIYLLHRFQRSRLGSRMMEVATQYARDRHCRRLLLGVYSRNEEALAFYERMGFTRVGERHFRVGAGEYYDHVLGKTL